MARGCRGQRHESHAKKTTRRHGGAKVHLGIDVLVDGAIPLFGAGKVIGVQTKIRLVRAYGSRAAGIYRLEVGNVCGRLFGRGESSLCAHLFAIARPVDEGVAIGWGCCNGSHLAFIMC